MMRISNTIRLLCSPLLAVVAATAMAGEAKSGYDYIKPASRAMQDDEFENPGMIAVERGQSLFNNTQDGADRSCADCHGKDGVKLDAKHIARYPVYNEDAGEIVTLQKRISRCRDGHTGGKP